MLYWLVCLAWLAVLVWRLFTFIAQEGFKMNKHEIIEPYILEDLHQSINDIFEQYDEGRIDREEANEIAKRCALAFVATLEDVAE
jgi:hypothetical protein